MCHGNRPRLCRIFRIAGAFCAKCFPYILHTQPCTQGGFPGLLLRKPNATSPAGTAPGQAQPRTAAESEDFMAFFQSAVGVLQTLVIALGAGLGIWGVINLMEGYGNDNPGANAHVR